MTDWGVIFLGVIAAATLATAIVQVSVMILAGRLARRVDHLAERIEHDLKPLLGQLHAVSRDASRISSLASAQAERVDHVVEDVVHRLDQALGALQSSAAGAAKEGAAVIAGVRATIETLKDLRMGRSRPRADEDDALFI